MSSILAGLNIDTHRLYVDVVNGPKGMDASVRQSVDIISEALRVINVKETWQCAFIKIHPKKCNIRFQFVRRVATPPRTIIVRTKPGGKQCWEIALRVPDQYDMHIIEEQLKKVDTRTLKLRTREERMAVPAPRVEKPVVPATPAKAPLISLSEDPVSTLPTAVLVKEAMDEVEREIAKRAKEIADKEALEIKKVAEVSVIPVSAVESLALPKSCIDACNDMEALDRGLFAISDFMRGKDGHILRSMAMQLVTNRLELEKFVDGHPVYNSSSRVAALVFKGLCDKSMLSRWYYGDGGGRSKPSEATKGFLLTPSGKKRLELISELYSATGNVANSFVSETSVKEITKATPVENHVIPPKPASQDTELIDKVANQFNILQPLMDQLDKSQGDLKAADDLLEENRKARIALEQRILAHKSKFDPLMARFKTLQEQMLATEEQVRVHAIENERILEEQKTLVAFHDRLVSDKQVEQKNMESIKAKMRDALS